MTLWQRFLSWFKPAPKPSPAPSPAPNPGGVKFTSQVVPIELFSAKDLAFMHNAQRAKVELHPLVLDPKLMSYAQSRADIAKRDHLTIEHIHDEFRITPGDTIDGENAAMGAADAASVMKGWMDSPGHRANILNPRYTRAGFGRSVDEQLVTRWFAEFGG